MFIYQNRSSGGSGCSDCIVIYQNRGSGGSGGSGGSDYSSGSPLIYLQVLEQYEQDTTAQPAWSRQSWPGSNELEQVYTLPV